MPITPLYLFLPLMFLTWLRKASAGVIQARDRAIEDSCHPHYTWAAPDVRQADCDATVDMFYDIEVRPLLWQKKEHDDYEFHSNRLPGGTGHPDRIMPRKYTVGTCTLAIVMLRHLQDKKRPLPIENLELSAYRDVASFYELWEAGDRLRKECKLYTLGMAVEGARESIGVFMWATNSWQNRDIPRGEPMPPWKPSMYGGGLLSLNTTAGGGFLSLNSTASEEASSFRDTE